MFFLNLECWEGAPPTVAAPATPPYTTSNPDYGKTKNSNDQKDLKGKWFLNIELFLYPNTYIL
jgi:hypothetical protein